MLHRITKASAVEKNFFAIGALVAGSNPARNQSRPNV